MAKLHPAPAANVLVQSYTHFTNTGASSGDNTMLTGPSAGTRLAIKWWKVQNESSTETTIILKDGSTAIFRHKLAAGEAIAFYYEEGHELRLASAAAFVLNLSGANSHGFCGDYFTEAVE